MKRVKKIGNYFTLETAARAEETDLLCDSCGNGDCSIRLIINRVKINRFNARVGVTRCESFVPILAFRDGAGLNSEFNTFRLGGAWAKRVSPGDTVALQTNAGESLGYAKVVDVHLGTFLDMQAEHGVDNHLAIDAELAGKDFDLAKVMTECYGGHRFNTQSTVSVIDLEKVDLPASEIEIIRRVVDASG